MHQGYTDFQVKSHQCKRIFCAYQLVL